MWLYLSLWSRSQAVFLRLVEVFHNGINQVIQFSFQLVKITREKKHRKPVYTWWVIQVVCATTKLFSKCLDYDYVYHTELTILAEYSAYNVQICIYFIYMYKYIYANMYKFNTMMTNYYLTTYLNKICCMWQHRKLLLEMFITS